MKFMANVFEIVCRIRMNGEDLDVYNSINEPWFLVDDIIDILSIGKKPETVIKTCDAADVRPIVLVYEDDKKVKRYFVNEAALYTIIMNSGTAYGRKFMSVIVENLIQRRRDNRLSFCEKMEYLEGHVNDIHTDIASHMLPRPIKVYGED